MELAAGQRDLVHDAELATAELVLVGHEHQFWVAELHRWWRSVLGDRRYHVMRWLIPAAKDEQEQDQDQDQRHRGDRGDHSDFSVVVVVSARPTSPEINRRRAHQCSGRVTVIVERDCFGHSGVKIARAGHLAILRPAELGAEGVRAADVLGGGVP